MEIEDRFWSINWIRLIIYFKCNSNINPKSPLFTMEAVSKAISDITWGIPKNDWANRPIFHFTKRRHDFKPDPANLYQVEFFFTDKDMAEVSKWVENLKLYFSEPHNRRTFYPVEITPPQIRNISNLINELGEIPDSGEICLYFMSPYHFKLEPGKTRCYHDAKSLINGIIGRTNRLFKKNFSTFSSTHCEALPYYWEYSEIEHPSRSQPGNNQFINGCIGPLYLRGNFISVKPWLYLASELHAGTKLAYSFGYFMLIPKNRPYFDLHFRRVNYMKHLLNTEIKRYEEVLLQYVHSDCDKNQNNKKCLNILYGINNGTYTPKPYRAFIIKSWSGKEYRFELPGYQDFIAGLFALEPLTHMLTKALDKESLGFHKNSEREETAKMLFEAINQGYSWVVESNIENFFPCVNLDKLEQLFDKHLPAKDINFRKFIKAIIRAPVRMGDNIIERNYGVAYGHPLSPCLTNLYLNAFDEKIKSLDIRIIRYADDFLIFCRTPEQAKSVVGEIEKILIGLNPITQDNENYNCNINRKPLYVGHDFLPKGTDILEYLEANLLKKPFHVSEPEALINLQGQTLCVKRGDQILQVMPFRRISEITVSEIVGISTSLIKMCIKKNIPLKIALNCNYLLAPLKLGSCQYYVISTMHVAKNQSLNVDAMMRKLPEFFNRG